MNIAVSKKTFMIAGLSVMVATGCASRAGPDGMTGPTVLRFASDDGAQLATSADLPSPDIDATIFLIGDAGAARPGNPVLRTMERLAEAAPRRSTFFFLGDNLYPDGLDSVGGRFRESDENRLRLLASVGQDSSIRSIFLSGNHDWNDSRPGGWRAVIDQQEFIDNLGVENLSFLPKGGCPGPEVIDLGAALRVVLLDTEWWLHEYSKPGPDNSDCQQTTESAVLSALDAALANAGERRTVVIAHHPLSSGGPHGGYLGWKDHIFPLRRLASWAWLPLPGVGSLYPLIRTLGTDPQDLGSSEYEGLKDGLTSVLRRHDVIAFVGGHDHSLQVIRDDAAGYSLVSGAGPSTGVTPVAWMEDTEFAVSAPGFMRMDVFTNGSVRLGVFAADSRGTMSEVYARWLTTLQETNPPTRG